MCFRLSFLCRSTDPKSGNGACSLFSLGENILSLVVSIMAVLLLSVLVEIQSERG